MKGLYELLSYCRPYQRTAYLRGVIGTVFPRCHTRENIELLMEVNCAVQPAAWKEPHMCLFRRKNHSTLWCQYGI